MAYYNGNKSYGESGRDYTAGSSVDRPANVDAPDYSRSQTGGSLIFPYRTAPGGNATAKVITNVLIWLLVFGVGFFFFSFVWPLIKKWKGWLSPDKDAANTKADEDISKQRQEIMKHSSDRMQNGDTYLQAAMWLSTELHRKWFDIFKDVDEERVGEYMLGISKAEFKQLELVYKEYRDSTTSWYENWSSGSYSLMDDLKTPFDDSQEVKYLSHLL